MKSRKSVYEEEMLDFPIPPHVKTKESFSKHNPPAGILVFELNTLFDYKKSRDTETVCLKNPVQLRMLLNRAEQQNVMLLIATSQSPELNALKSKAAPALGVKNIMDAIGLNYFDAVYFTGPKKNELLTMLCKYYLGDLKKDTKKRVYFVDNRPKPAQGSPAFNQIVKDSPEYNEIFLDHKSSDWDFVLKKIENRANEKAEDLADEKSSVMAREPWYGINHELVRQNALPTIWEGDISPSSLSSSDDKSDESVVVFEASLYGFFNKSKADAKEQGSKPAYETGRRNGK